MARVGPGDSAPDFELDGTDGRFKLSAHRGERVVLLFYPGDDTPVCTRQFCSYRDRPDELGALDATVVGISSQSLDSHRAFSTNNQLTVPLLADEGASVAKAYGAWRRGLGTKRAVVIVDEEGIVRYRHDHLLGVDYQSVDELAEALEAVTGSARPA
jgi:thioredoxin-dependent peroxiredoxin